MNGCYIRNSILPFEEALDVEFKGHRDFSFSCVAIRKISDLYICIVISMFSFKIDLTLSQKCVFVSPGHKPEPYFQKKLAAMFASLYEASQPNQPRGTNACTAGGPLDATVCCWWCTQCSKKEIERQKTVTNLKPFLSINYIY